MTVTLLYSTYNRSGLLQRSLERLREFTLPDEIIVVDDGGTDNCQNVCETSGLPVRYVYNHRPYDALCCQSRNVGIRAATGDEILITEPEVMFVTDVIAQLLEARREIPDCILHGATYRGQENNPDPDPEHFEVVIPYFTMYRRDWLLDVGGYDEGFEDPYAWDDVDLNTRLGHAGHPLALIFQARAFHQWHPSRNMPADRNQARHRAKRWPQDIIANQDHDWGAVLCR